VIADVEHPFDPVAGDAESLELRWVPAQDVDALELHPAFAKAWTGLRALLDTRPAIVVDVPALDEVTAERSSSDGSGAADTVLAQLDRVAAHGVPGHALGLDGERWYPQVDAIHDGVLERAQERIAGGFSVVVVTDDSSLADESARLGAASRVLDWLVGVASA